VDLYSSEGRPQPSHFWFGATFATLSFDGQTTTADVHFLPAGRVTGRVRTIWCPDRGSGRPERPCAGHRGHLSFEARGSSSSDPGSGAFAFGQLPVGPYALVASSPFYAVQVSSHGRRRSTRET